MNEPRILENAITKLKELRARKEDRIDENPFVEFQILSETIEQLEKFYSINTAEISSIDKKMPTKSD